MRVRIALKAMPAAVNMPFQSAYDESVMMM
jgi:hypothetical protein